MAWQKFIVEILHYAAWPGAVFFIAYIFRKPIERLVDRIKKVKHKDTEIDLLQAAEVLESATQETPTFVHPTKLTEENCKWPSVLDLTYRYTLALIVCLQKIPLDQVSEFGAARLSRYMHVPEKMLSSFKGRWSNDKVERVDESIAKLRKRFAPILENPSWK